MTATRRYGIGYQRADGKKIVCYEVYESASGSAEAYLGRASTLRQARRMAAQGGGLPPSMYDTARAAGHCGGYSAPSLGDDEERDSEPACWFGRGGVYCAVPVWK